MAGKIIADTLETGAGADIATSYVVNGSAKAWVNFNGGGTPAARDSFNHSSLTDVGTGHYTNNITSSFNYSDNYIVMSGTVAEAGGLGRGVSGAMLYTTNVGSSGVPSNQNAGSYQVRYAYGSNGSSNGSESDHGVIHSMAMGDLA